MASMGTLSCEQCGKPLTPKQCWKANRYCSLSCAGKQGGQPIGSNPDTYLRRKLLDLLRGGVYTDHTLAMALYGENTSETRIATRLLIERARNWLARKGYHIVPERVTQFSLHIGTHSHDYGRTST